ncbi:MAG: hypothetical protein JST75_21930 [Bacteroidetes bacterium]|nr:hypothetical protein [Bacteroidota bacterium]
MGAVKPLDRQIVEWWPHLNTKQKEVVLSVVKSFVQEEETWWNDIEDNAKESIERGLKQADQGKITPHKEVMKKYKKWLSK